MKNNFGLILLDLVRSNKDKFLGLLRRNGVLVNTNVSNENLTNMILGAMKKSESFNKEAVTLMSVLMSSSDKSFSNAVGLLNTNAPITFGSSSSNAFENTQTFDPIFSTSTTSNSSSPTTTTNKKDFADTTVGSIFDKLFTLGQSYLTAEELKTRQKEAEAGVIIAQSGSNDSQGGNVQAPKSNVGLYVGLGIGGLALVGVLVYIIAKKK
jgi:hypothetical protein